MGICISLTAKPIKPMIKKPTATALEISRNSEQTSASSFSYSPDTDANREDRTAFIWFCASIQEERAIFNKVAGNIEDLFDLVRHGGVLMFTSNL